jgi:hypothetical protein
MTTFRKWLSDLGRLILTDGLNHISERSILKLE